MLIVALSLLTLTAQVSPPVTESSMTAAGPSDFEVVLDMERGVLAAHARSAALAAIGKHLEGLLRIPVHVSPALAGRKVSFRKMTKVPLADVLGQLAPVVLVESHEVLGQSSHLLAIHLLDRDQPTPPPPQQRGIAIQGHTDDVLDAPDEASGSAVASEEAMPASPPEGPFLRVKRLPDGRLSVDARDQGLGVLLFEVAKAYGVRFDLSIPEAPMVGRLSINGIQPSELPTYVGVAGAGVDVRRNVATGEETLLRVFVTAVP